MEAKSLSASPISFVGCAGLFGAAEIGNEEVGGGAGSEGGGNARGDSLAVAPMDEVLGGGPDQVVCRGNTLLLSLSRSSSRPADSSESFIEPCLKTFCRFPDATAASTEGAVASSSSQ